MKKVLVLICCSLLSHLGSAQTLLVYGNRASEVEINASRELEADLQTYTTERVVRTAYTPRLSTKGYTTVIYVGTPQSHDYVKECQEKGTLRLLEEALQPETFVLETTGPKSCVIAGADVRGTFYGVYEFSKQLLGTDPYAYWTDRKPGTKQPLQLPALAYRETAPAFPYRGYFDNDNDLLANWKGEKLIVELDIWKEMINSLARLRYNYIDLHDLLGRPEYYLRDYYKQMTDFHTDLELVDQVIDYAHSKGMLVQIPMYLGWEFHHMDFDKVSLSKHHDHWMEVYEYYLTQTPLGKADLFLQRPRHPYYDWAYKCEEETAAGIKTGPLMNKMFEGLYQLIRKHRPEAILFCDLWSEGRPLWKSGEFAPNKEIQMLWADAGYANFGEWPGDLQGYPFGIYIHAGVWKNNVTQDPYPAAIRQATLQAVDRQMTSNYFVNGQTFKNFILNLEACARCAWNPHSFDPEAFYAEWTTRYFGPKASPGIVEVLKFTHEANQPIGGFRDIMQASIRIMTQIEKGEARREEPFNTTHALLLARKAFATAQEQLPLVPATCMNGFQDQILFPAEILVLNIELSQAILEYNNLLITQPAQPTLAAAARRMQSCLCLLLERLNAGSGWQMWDGFYKPENFRIHTPPPTLERMNKMIARNVKL